MFLKLHPICCLDQHPHHLAVLCLPGGSSLAIPYQAAQKFPHRIGRIKGIDPVWSSIQFIGSRRWGIKTGSLDQLQMFHCPNGLN